MPRPLPDAPPLACLTGWSTPKPRPFHVTQGHGFTPFLLPGILGDAAQSCGCSTKGQASQRRQFPAPSPQPVSREGPAFSGLIPCFSSHQKKKALWPKHRR